MVGAAFVLGVIAGLLGGGSLKNLSSIRIRWPRVLMVALAIGLVPLVVDMSGDVRHAFQLASHAGLLLFFAGNISRAHGLLRIGFVVVAIGWLCNFLAIVANGGMPLSVWAWRHAGLSGAPTPGEGTFYKGVIAGDDTLLKPLGDVIPVRLIQNVISVGDILILIGIAIVIAAGMMTSRRAAPATLRREPA